MKKILIITIATLFISACGGAPATSTGNNAAPTKDATKDTAPKPAAGANKLEIKIKDKTYTLDQKSAYLSSEDMTINLEGGKSVKTSDRSIMIANYDLDMSLGPFMAGKKMTSPDNVRVVIKIQDKEDTNKDAAPSTGDYVSKYPDNFMKFLSVWVFTHAEGAKDTDAKIVGGYDNVKGGAKITAVNGDTVTGEIDINNGADHVKGSFTAKIWKQGQK